MARPKKDISNYKRLPEVHWSKFRDEEYSIGIMSKAPDCTMMTTGGIVILVPNDKERIVQPVRYDAEYVFSFFHRSMVVKMGYCDEGVLDKEALTHFINGFLIYCEALSDAKKEKQLRSDAESMHARYPSKTVDEWMELLVAEQQQKTNEPTETQSVDDDEEVDFVPFT
jgi:hypothetical protein